MSDERLARITEQALERARLADMRPLYRKLLVRLKGRDPEAFQQATRRYEEELVPAIASGEADPLAEWLAYGRWIAEKLGPGELVAIDGSGRASPFEPGTGPEPGALLLHLPHADRVPAIALAVPADPSVAQRVTTELLVR